MAHTGAMIALVPSAADAQRLAVDGGEDPDELHLTLLYLGEADMIPAEVRSDIITVVQRWADDLASTVVGDAFAVNMFNPLNMTAGAKEPCVVLGVGGDQLANLQEVLANSVNAVFTRAGIPMHPQHRPWTAHITLVYTEDADLTYFTDRTGPVTFDRIRVAFGDDVFDITLGTREYYDDIAHDDDNSEPYEPDDMTAADAAEDVLALGDDGDSCGCKTMKTTEMNAATVDDIEFTADGEPIVPNVLLDWRAWVTAERERDVNIPGGPGHNLRNYWVRGPGAAKIRWGTDGSFARCVAHLSKYVKRPQGLCAEYHKLATGEWPAEKGVPSSGGTLALGDNALYRTTEDAHDEEVTAVSAAAAKDDPKKPYGDVEYADPGYQSDGVKRYPLDTETHIRAAWAYINMPRNASKYSREDLRKVRAKIAAAMRKLGVDVSASLDEDIVAAAVVKPGAKNVKKIEDAYAPEVLSPEISPVSSAMWRGVLTVEGVESGDGRMFAPGSLTWDEPPLPLMWQKETSHGGSNNVSVRVGSINKIWREPADNGDSGRNVIMGEGTLDLGSPDGREVFRRMKAKYLRGNSVDVDSVKNSNIEFSFPESEIAGDGTVNVFAKPELVTYKKGRIRASTLVDIPAFSEARLELVDVPDGAVPMADVEDIDAQAVGLVAATSVIEITDAPPREWFDEPRDVQMHGALTVTSKGRIYGYVAPAGVRHRSFIDREQYVPMGNVDYSRFMSGETIVADGGRVATGPITMNCGHATTRRSLTAAQAAEHYENSCSIVATARVGENSHGVWIAGALLPDITPATVQRIMACKLSGDWRPHLDRPGWREFVAALLVPVPGFPMARRAASVEVADGQLVASSVPVELAVDEPTSFVSQHKDIQPAGSRDVVAALSRRVRVAQLRGVVAEAGRK